MVYLTLLIICQLKPLYNNHSHNHKKYEGLISINIKDFLRQEKKKWLNINIKINSHSYTTIMHIPNWNKIKPLFLGKGYINALLGILPLIVVLEWPPAMIFSSSTFQASKKNFLFKTKHKHKHQPLLLKLKGLFIGSTQILEALEF
jgi:hypothetical protein